MRYELLIWKKKDRDLVVYALFDRGVLQNIEIGRVFAVPCWAACHMVKEAKEGKKKARHLWRNAHSINSQFKMWPRNPD